MRGVIVAKDVVRHFALIRREFGNACAARCLWAIVTGKRTTFLSLVFDRGSDLLRRRD